MKTTVVFIAMCLPFAAPAPLAAQHAPGHGHAAADSTAASALPTLAGQDAYAAIAEIVDLLERDPSTDWSHVDLEGLRQHLIDMHDVTLQSAVRQRPVPGGLLMDVTGSGRTTLAIRRMLRAHAAQLASSSTMAASAQNIVGGARFTVTARDTADTTMAARIRGLGFIGLLTIDDHHRAHHLALAKGLVAPL